MKKLHFLAIAVLLFSFSSFAQDRSVYTLIHLSDLHVATEQSLVNTCDLNGAEANCYLTYFRTLNPKPAFIVASGDISNVGNSSNGGMYSALTQFLYPKGLVNPGIGAYFIDSAQTIPLYFAPGNHDYYTTLYPPGTLTQLDTLTNYSHYISPDTDYAIINDISVILFIRSGWDVSYLISTDPLGSGLTDAQCNWIRSVLSANSSKRKILVMHHPGANLNGTDCDGTAHTSVADSSYQSLYNNRENFLNICDSNHVDVILCGHTHQNVVVDRSGNLIEENCTTCGPRFVQTGPAFDGCYREITVSSGFVSVSLPMQGCSGVIDTTTTPPDTTITPPDTTKTTSIRDVDNELNISIYPDPSNGLFNLNLGTPMQVMLKIYNALGQCVYQQTSTSASSNLQVDLRSQPGGMYFLQLIANEGPAVTYNFKYSLVVNK